MAHAWEKSYPAGVNWNLDLPPLDLVSFFNETTAKFTSRPCFDFMDKLVTYGEFRQMVDRAAKGFQKLGVGPGVHVGLFLPNTPHYPIAFFGILKAGGVVVNYSPLDAERELKFKIEDSQTDIIVTLGLNALYPKMAGFLGSTRLKKIVVGGVEDFLPFPKNLLFPLARRKDISAIPADDRHIRFKALLDNDGSFKPVPVTDPGETLAALQYTGGTTGTTKGAMLTHQNFTATLRLYGHWSDSDGSLKQGEERVLAVLPLFHIYGLSALMLRALHVGSLMVLHPRFELEAVVRDLVKKRITVFAGVPTMYTGIANHPRIAEMNLSGLKQCACGGAPLPLEVQEKFEQLTGIKVSEGWGMTETAPAGAATPLVGLRKKGSCGLPLPRIEISVVDVDDPDKVLPLGQRGEICIKGPNVMKGYWNKPAETAEAFRGGHFHTGDIGYLDEDGFMFLVDRKKDMILSGGFNVYPRNIEEAIYEYPAVEEVTVIGIPDAYRGQAAKAFVKLRAGAKPFTIEELNAFLKDKLGKHELPAAVDFRAELPKTPVGKLSKKELYEEEQAKRDAGARAA